jgi:hypothetical protein
MGERKKSTLASMLLGEAREKSESNQALFTRMTTNVFSISVTGQIESAHIPQHDHLYCKFGYHFGPDWTVLNVLYRN